MMKLFRRAREPRNHSITLSLAGRVFRPAASILTTTMDGQVTVLDLDRDRYYGLDEVGTAIWSLVEQSKTFEQIVERLGEEYEASRAEVERDVGVFLRHLRKHRLVVDA